MDSTDLYDLIKKADAILTGLQFVPTNPYVAGSALPVFTTQQVLIHEYVEPTSTTYDRAKAEILRATNNGKWSAKTPHAIAFTIVLNCRKFVTPNRLAEFGANLDWYWARWLNYLDLTEVLILADRLNSLENNDAKWATAGLVLPDGFAILDKPKRALIVSWLNYVKDGLPAYNSANTEINLSDTKYSAIGFTAFDFAFNKITKTESKTISLYLDEYKVERLKVQDSYIPGV